jgi:hypothetical protein
MEGSACFDDLGLLDIIPFWADFPHVGPALLFTPDLLHQLHKGMIKDHLVKWLAHIQKPAKMSEQYVSMSDHHGIRHFKNGITSVSQWKGCEQKEMAKVLLVVAADMDAHVVKATQVLMDFAYLAHSLTLTDVNLDAMEEALRVFHEHKGIVQSTGAQDTEKGFHGRPKLHMIMHYVRLIWEHGTPDGFNTETPNRMHIDCAKSPYRASNKVNAIKQMALFIDRMEAIAIHRAHLDHMEVDLDKPEHEVDKDEWEDQDEDDDENADEDDEGEGVGIGQLQVQSVIHMGFMGAGGGEMLRKRARRNSSWGSVVVVTGRKNIIIQ